MINGNGRYRLFFFIMQNDLTLVNANVHDNVIKLKMDTACRDKAKTDDMIKW